MERDERVPFAQSWHFFCESLGFTVCNNKNETWLAKTTYFIMEYDAQGRSEGGPGVPVTSPPRPL